MSAKPTTGEPTMHELRPGVDEAQDCWQRGVQPLVDVFGTAAVNLVRAIAISHREPFPVPVFITGNARGGADVLLHAISELTDAPIVQRSVITLPTLRLTAAPRTPLLVDNAAPADDIATPSMFQKISDETLDDGSPLQEVSILVATGGRKLGRELRSRTLHIALPSTGPTASQRKALTSISSASARRLVQIYLEQNARRAALPAKIRHSFDTILTTTNPPGLRCTLALTAADALLRKLQLPIPIAPVDQVLQATRTAVQDALHAGTGAARMHGDTIYAIPAAILPKIRAAATNQTIKHYDVARSLEVARLLTPATNEKDSTTPSRDGATLQRVWRISPDLLT